MRLSVERYFNSKPSHGLATYDGTVTITMETDDTATTVEYMAAFITAAAAVDVMLDTDEPEPGETDETRESLKVTVKSGVDPAEVAKAINETMGGDIHAVQLGDTPRPRLRGRIPGAI